MLSSAIWGPAICKACWNSSLPVQQRSAAIHILKQIINEDLSSLRSFCSSLYFTDETDGTRPKLFWTQEVWNYLLGEANLAKGISHVPLPLQQVIFCTHSDVALLDTEHMPELELQDVYALFFYVVDPNKAVREAIANLIVSASIWSGGH
ncbi:uncharacterized protein ACA1_228400 [Acanthamoeba castellanii str. Neff]|uniref:Uncharacterized protein n=1 Tax=Acanthamoeba castellanii (strain ATCC 30010 / Neff) TaxID=1257118 RepID=L8H7Y1_ACACF|nr:uncharacterized protein ACA1_228400 [Acanthamoeba castellanii str. Neff]ELR21589.1 hypothetical protein ACA1_228400 [Acanthamoeba castellanii str. Neff]